MICVQNHYTRNTSELEKRIIETANGVEYKVFTDSTDYYKDRRSPYRYFGIAENFLNMLREKTDSPYKIIIHDDVSIHDKLFANIEIVMQYADTGLTGFYNPTNNLYNTAFQLGHHVVSSCSNFWMQCIAIDTNWGFEFVKWVEENMMIGRTSEDGMMWSYLSITNQPAKIVIPSFVQHEGYDRSTFNNPYICGGNLRNSATYDPSFNPLTVNWKHEFANPYLDKQKKIFKKAINE